MDAVFAGSASAWYAQDAKWYAQKEANRKSGLGGSGCGGIFFYDRLARLPALLLTSYQLVGVLWRLAP